MFWYSVSGLAARGEFEDQTISLIMDAFIQNMDKPTMQERVRTEQKAEPMEALRFAIASEEREPAAKSRRDECKKRTITLNN